MEATSRNQPPSDSKQLFGRSSRDIVHSLGIDPREAPRILLRVVALGLRYRARFILAIVASVGASFFGLVAPKLLGHAVDQADQLLRLNGGNDRAALRGLTATALLILVTSSLRGVLQMASGFQSETIGQCVGRDLRLAFFEKLQRLGFDYHDHVHSGDLITRGMLDLEGVRGFLENGLQRLVSLVLLLGIGGTMLFLVDPLMAVLTLSFVPFVIWRAGRMGLQLRLAWTRLQERLSVLTRVMEENLQGARVVRAFASSPFEMAKFDVAGNEALAFANQRIVVRSSAMSAISSAYYLAMMGVLWVGGHRVASGALTVGQLTQFLAFMTVLQLPVRQVGMIMNSSSRAISSGKRLFEVLDRAPTIQDRPDAAALHADEGVLRFEHVSFRYGPDAPLALDDVSFSVSPGTTLGIVGSSGAGKSTIAQLAPRFYDVTGGKITIDGQDIRDVTLGSLRSAVSVVQQDVFLFDDSVQANVAYADPEAEDHAVLDATATAQMHDHVMALPLGYGAPVGERGMGLSGGQRQRLSIARGMVVDPRIVIFDDATSAVDAATEHRLRSALREATSRQATIIISHRLGSLMHADEIIVLDAGRIIERGSHRDLLAQGGYYAALYELQSEPGARSDEEAQKKRVDA
jgi:ATP-binding cassette subfamily B protein